MTDHLAESLVGGSASVEFAEAVSHQAAHDFRRMTSRDIYRRPLTAFRCKFWVLVHRAHEVSCGVEIRLGPHEARQKP